MTFADAAIVSAGQTYMVVFRSARAVVVDRQGCAARSVSVRRKPDADGAGAAGPDSTQVIRRLAVVAAGGAANPDGADVERCVPRVAHGDRLGDRSGKIRCER